MTFGERLKVMMSRRKISARFVGREADITSGHMTFLTSDQSVPSAEKLCRLADVFGVTMDELWRGVGRCSDANLNLAAERESHPCDP